MENWIVKIESSETIPNLKEIGEIIYIPKILNTNFVFLKTDKTKEDILQLEGVIDCEIERTGTFYQTKDVRDSMSNLHEMQQELSILKRKIDVDIEESSQLCISYIKFHLASTFPEYVFEFEPDFTSGFFSEKYKPKVLISSVNGFQYVKDNTWSKKYTHQNSAGSEFWSDSLKKENIIDVKTLESKCAALSTELNVLIILKRVY